MAKRRDHSKRFLTKASVVGITGAKYKGEQSIPKSFRRIEKSTKKTITYVIDTNVYMSSWDAINKFREHEVCMPAQVWQELDNHKKGKSDASVNTRLAIRTIDKLVAGNKSELLQKGILIESPEKDANGKAYEGKLFFDFSVPKIPEGNDIDLSLDNPDDRIIMICLGLIEKGKRVVLVSNDGNCRVKARVAGVESEEYLNEIATDIVGEEDLRPGFHHMPEDFWDKLTSDPVTSKRGGVTTYTLSHRIFRKVNCNEFLIIQKDDLRLIVIKKPRPEQVIATTFTNFMSEKNKVFGVTPKNLEQEFALQLLMDERISGLSIAGMAGSGKTFLTMAAALHLTFDLHIFKRVLITRSIVGSDEDIGFLPGTEEEKMTPWMGSVYDNLEVLVGGGIDSDDKQQSAGEYYCNKVTTDFIKNRVQIKALNFMKGRTINNTFIIVDEVQDLTAKKLKMIATRVGPGSKIVFLGNVGQIDDSYLTEHTCGLSVFIRSFATSSISGHVTLQRGERSAFATEADDRL